MTDYSHIQVAVANWPVLHYNLISLALECTHSLPSCEPFVQKAIAMHTHITATIDF